MFETEDFRKRLAKVVSTEAAINSMKKYQPEIVTYLQRLAAANERDLMESELEKPTARRRGIDDALQSVRQLIKEASQIALSDERTLLTEADVRAAAKVLFCGIWPFCK